MNGEQRVVKKRRRPTVSCEQCRRKRIKCDHEKPCSNCKERNEGPCLYKTLQKDDVQVLHSFPLNKQIDAPLTPESPGIFGQNTSVLPPNDSALQVSMSCAEETAQGSKRWCVRNLEQFTTVRRTLEEFDGSDDSILFKKCKKIARAIKAHFSMNIPIPGNVQDYLPPRDMADSLISRYFEIGESVFRIVHIPSFQKEYEQYWEDPSAARTPFLIQALLVMAIGASFKQMEANAAQLRSLAYSWIDIAQSWSNPLFNRKSRINLAGIQIQCLVILAREILSIGTDHAWIANGTLLHTATYMNLHRDPSIFPGMSNFEAEMRRRLWASVLELLLQASLNSGHFLQLSRDDYDCKPPSNYHELDLDPAMTSDVKPRAENVFTQSTFQVLLMHSFPIRLEIAKKVNHWGKRPSYEDVNHLGKQFSTVCKDLPVEVATDEGEVSINTFQRKAYDILTKRTLLELHQPFAMRAGNNPIYYYSRKVCMDTTLTLMSSFLGKSSENHDDAFAILIARSGGTFKTVPLACMAIIWSELLGELEQPGSSTLSFSYAQPSFRQDIHNLLRRFADLKRDGVASVWTNNIRAYLFIRAITAQIECLEQKKPPHEAMRAALSEALSSCYEALKAEAVKISPDLVELPSAPSTIVTTPPNAFELDWAVDDFDGLELGLIKFPHDFGLGLV